MRLILIFVFLAHHQTIIRMAAAHYEKPPYETTFLADTGLSSDFSNPYYLGERTILPISASLAGCRQIQYNKFFWNDNLYTFKTSNNAVGLMIAYFNPVLSRTYMVVVPFFVPRLTICDTQDITVPMTYYSHQQLIRQFLFYLNLNFISCANTALLAQDYLGTLSGSGNPFFPLFSDTSYCPFAFQLAPNGKQILFGPTDTAATAVGEGQFAYQFVPLEKYMFSAQTRILTTDPASGHILTSSTPNSSSVVVANLNKPEKKGWVYGAPYVSGLGYYDVYEKNYDFIMGENGVEDLFSMTSFPTTSPSSGPNNLPETWSDFALFCSTYSLSYSGFISFSRICSFLPSRFYLTHSNTLSSKQQRPFVSNNSAICQSDVIGIHLHSLEYQRSYTDETLSGGVSTRQDSATIRFDPFFTVSQIDLQVTDEQNKTIISTYGVDGFSDPKSIASLAADTIEHVFSPSRVLSIPGAYLARHPDPVANPDGQTCFSNETILLGVNKQNIFLTPPDGKTVAGGDYYAPIPYTFEAAFPLQNEITHFLRVIGIL